MRQDQFEKLQEISENLTDVFIAEADVSKWPGATIPVDQQDKTIRGDRYWQKKNAVATIALITRVSVLTGIIKRNTSSGNVGGGSAGVMEEDMDREIQDAEKEAAKLMKRINDPANKANYDIKVHGKAKN